MVVLSALSTDLYELTMVGGYYVKGMSAPATFDLFVRNLPPTRNYLVACGIGQHVAGKLLEGELVERHVRVKGMDDPIAVGPDGAGTVFLVAVRIGIAGEVEPAPRPPLPIVRRREEPVH